MLSREGPRRPVLYAVTDATAGGAGRRVCVSQWSPLSVAAVCLWPLCIGYEMYTGHVAGRGRKTCQKNGRTADEGSLAALLTAAYLAAHYLATALSGALLATHLGGWTSTRPMDVAPK